MKRDWDLIREVLIEVETLTDKERTSKIYGMGDENYPGEAVKSEHALLLWDAGYLTGINAGTMGGTAIISPNLTWQGHDLLDTVRSKPVWERIKTTAKEKGVELTFDAVKLLGVAALEAIVRS